MGLWNEMRAGRAREAVGAAARPARPLRPGRAGDPMIVDPPELHGSARGPAAVRIGPRDAARPGLALGPIRRQPLQRGADFHDADVAGAGAQRGDTFAVIEQPGGDGRFGKASGRRIGIHELQELGDDVHVDN